MQYEIIKDFLSCALEFLQLLWNRKQFSYFTTVERALKRNPETIYYLKVFLFYLENIVN